jgi:hypothetical protein
LRRESGSRHRFLPQTPTAEEAELYSELHALPDKELRAAIKAHSGIDKDLDEAADLRIPLLRQLITIKLREGNVINQNYKYVDGTSFCRADCIFDRRLHPGSKPAAHPAANQTNPD